MTWFTTWPHNGIPQYAEHRTEQKAATHAETDTESETQA